MFDPAIFKILGYVLTFLLVAPIFPLLYVVLRWRTAGDHPAGLGTYCALLYFRTAALLLGVAGLANLSYGWISTTPIQPEWTRLSWGLFWGAFLFLGLNLGLGRLLHVAASVREARRMFGGFLSIMAGIVALFSLINFFVTVYHEVDPDNEKAGELRADDLKLWGSWTLYFLALYITTIVLLAKRLEFRGRN